MDEGSPESQYWCDPKGAYNRWLSERGFDKLSLNPGAEEIWSAGYAFAHSAIAARQQEPDETPMQRDKRMVYFGKEAQLRELLCYVSPNSRAYDAITERLSLLIKNGSNAEIFCKEHDAAIRRMVLDKIVLMTLDHPCTEDYSPNLLGCSRCPFAISYDNGEDCVIRSLLATTPAPGNRDYQCGDNCHGECSGEYDGRIHCPVSEAEQRIADVIAELEKRNDECLLPGNFGEGRIMGRKEAISLLKNGVKKDGE